jgi:hypothetical protein
MTDQIRSRPDLIAASAVLARGGDPPEPPAVLARGATPRNPRGADQLVRQHDAADRQAALPRARQQFGAAGERIGRRHGVRHQPRAACLVFPEHESAADRVVRAAAQLSAARVPRSEHHGIRVKWQALAPMQHDVVVGLEVNFPNAGRSG